MSSPNTSTLTLNASGSGGCTPDPNPWKPPKGSSVSITNNTTSSQTLTNITPGLLNPAPGNSITVPTTGWSGTVGNSKGTYNYDDGLKTLAIRSGTIDPT